MIGTTYQYSFSTKATNSVNNCLYYLLYYIGGTGNPQAASNFIKNLDLTLEKISHSAEAYAICEEEQLSKINQRKAHFAHMQYKVFFHIDKNGVVIIDLVAHDMQDYSRILLDND